MKRQLQSEDEDKPCCSRSLRNPPEAGASSSTTSAEPEKAQNPRARRNWAALSQKIREALLRREAPIQMPCGLFQLERNLLTSRLNPDLSIILPPDCNRSRPEDLVGFDNTGNVRVWAGGEALAAFLLLNPSFVAEQRVIELGSGFLGLPGLVSALVARNVTITDGNDHSVAVVTKIIAANSFPKLTCGFLRWGEKTELGSFGVLLAADCIFFRENHKRFLDSCHYLLADGPESSALICSPTRKGSLTAFLEFVERDGRFTAVSCEEFTHFVIQHMPQFKIGDIPWLYVLKRVVSQ